MDILFENGEISVHDVQTRLPNPPGYSAVRALLARLLDKGAVSYRQDGARYLYRASIDTETARETAVNDLLKTFFGNSPVAAASALLGISQQQMSADERATIVKMIAAAEAEESS